MRCEALVIAMLGLTILPGSVARPAGAAAADFDGTYLPLGESS
jgi:hypothetical protein